MSRILGLLTSLLLAAAVLAGCGDDGSTGSSGGSFVSGTAVPTATITATPALPSPPATATAPTAPAGEVSGEAAYRHVVALAEEIGPRPAGTAAEREAAQYIAAQMASYGYTVVIAEFPLQEVRGATLAVTSPKAMGLAAAALRGSAAGQVTAEVVDGGLGRPSEFPADGLKGRIALIRRGEIPFSAKVTNAAAAGAAAAIVYNNAPGPFGGDLQGESAILAVAIPGQEGQELLALLDKGPVVVSLTVTASSQSVVARPPGTSCRVIVGAHFDSVPGGPGANDNASGTAAAIEVARAVAPRSSGLGACFVAFGAEEIGLWGSQAFVAGLDAADRKAVRGMINLDMVGVGDQWKLIGSTDLVAEAKAQAEALGIAVELYVLPSQFGSDHQSFISAGIPAVFIHRLDDPLYHTPDDVASRVQPQALAEAGRLTLRLIEVLAAP